MSRSRAKTKAMKAGGRRQSDKKDKVSANKKLRRKTRQMIGIGEDEEKLPNIRDVSDTWNFSSDGGATYWTDLPEKCMRK